MDKKNKPGDETAMDVKYGRMAELSGMKLPLEVLRSAAGYYLGTQDDDGPVSRESEEYWRTEKDARHALKTNSWTQRSIPLINSAGEIQAAIAERRQIAEGLREKREQGGGPQTPQPQHGLKRHGR